MADPPIEVNIEIRGLSLCFLKPAVRGAADVWNVAFVCDQRHPLDITHNGKSVPRTKGNDFFLCVEPLDFSNAPCRSGNFDKLLNLSDSVYGHGKNLATGLSHLNIERRNSKIADVVWLQVPHSEMTVSEDVDCSMMQSKPGALPPVNVDKRGKVATLTFHVTADFTLTWREYPRVPVPVPTPVPHPEPGNMVGRPYSVPISDLVGGKINLSFNNDCRHHGCRFNDSEDIYELVVHRESGEEVRFMSWSRNAAAPAFEEFLATAKGEELPPDFRHWDYIVKANPYGNCDPYGSEPPPGP